MARQSAPLVPPHKGWHYDSKSRGWYAPGFASYQAAKETGGEFWLSRRQYDQEIGRLKGTGLTFEGQAKLRKGGGVTRFDTDVETQRGGWLGYETDTFETLIGVLRRLPVGNWFYILVHGVPSTTSPKEENRETGWRTVLPVRLTNDYTQLLDNDIYANATRLFDRIDSWVLRWKPRARSQVQPVVRRARG